MCKFDASHDAGFSPGETSMNTAQNQYRSNIVDGDAKSNHRPDETTTNKTGRIGQQFGSMGRWWIRRARCNSLFLLGDPGQGFGGCVADEAVFVIHRVREDSPRTGVTDLPERPHDGSANTRLPFLHEGTFSSIGPPGNRNAFRIRSRGLVKGAHCVLQRFNSARLTYFAK